MNGIVQVEIERHARAISDSATTAELLLAAVRIGRQLAGAVTHDLNSALQCVGDAVFAIREDTRGVADPQSEGAGVSPESVDASLALADDAFERLIAIARMVPELVPLVPHASDEPTTVDVSRELRDIAALTRSVWKNRIELSVDFSSDDEPFACIWWVARVAATRMVMLAAESEPKVGSGAPRPTVVLSSSQQAANVELRVRVSRPSSDAALSMAANEPITFTISDATLTLCAERLGGELERSQVQPGVMETVFRFPIQRDATPFESPFV